MKYLVLVSILLFSLVTLADDNEKHYGGMRLHDTVVGTFHTYTFEESYFGWGKVTSATIEGDPDITVGPTSCNGAEDNLCRWNFTFKPTSVGIKRARFKIHIVWGKYSSDNIWDFEGTGTEVKPMRGESCRSGSIIQVDSRTLREVIPVVGVPFSLYYSTQLAAGYRGGEFKSKKIYNPDSLTVSTHHYYDVGQGRLYLGNGTSVPAEAKYLKDGTLLVDSVNERQEVYVFNKEGVHLGTKTRKIGAWIYRFEYDTNSRLAGIFYGNQKLKVLIERDSNGNMTAIRGAFGQITQFRSNGRDITSVISPDGAQYVLTYYPQGLLKTFIKPGGQTSTFEYDSKGLLLHDVNAAGNSTSISMDSDSFISKVMKVTTAKGNSSLVRIEAIQKDNNAYFERTETDATGVETTTRQKQGRDEFFIGSYGTVSEYLNPDPRFGSAPNNWNSVSYGDGPWSGIGKWFYVNPQNPQDPYVYDNIQTSTYRSVNGSKGIVIGDDKFELKKRVQTISSVTGSKTLIAYDENERPIAVQRGKDQPVQFVYDHFGRLTSVWQRKQVIQKIAYDQYSNVASVANALGATKKFEYDINGRLRKMILEDGRQTRMSYDVNGNLSSLTPSNGKSTSFVMNAMEYISEIIPSLAQLGQPTATKYEYDLERRLSKIVKPSGSTVKLSYDAAGKLTELKSGTESIVNSYYDTDGTIDSSTTSDGVYTGYYFHGDMLMSKGQHIKGIADKSSSFQLEYNDYYQLKKAKIMRSNGANVTYGMTYDLEGKVTQIGNEILTYGYPSGRLLKRQLSNLTETRQYDEIGLIKSIAVVFTTNNKTLYSSNITRDAIGRISKLEENLNGKVTIFEYSYDVTGRLLQVKKNGAVYSSYQYDANGNRTQGLHAGAPFSASFDDEDRMLQYNQDQYQYDNDGNLISIKGSKNLQLRYSAFGPLNGVVNAQGEHKYYIDNEGNPIAVTGPSGLEYRSLFMNPWRMAAHFGPNDEMTVFGHGISVNSPDFIFRDNGNSYFVVKDHLGSVRMVVGAKFGGVAQEISYSDLGMVISDSAPGFQPYGFAGGLNDSNTGFVRFGARYYDAQTGRWISKDPIGFAGGDTNLYGYVLADPINYFDYNGKEPVSAGTAAVAAFFTGGTVNAIMSYRNGVRDPSQLFGSFMAGGVAGTVAGVGLVTGGLAAGVGVVSSFVIDIGSQMLNNVGMFDDPRDFANGVRAIKKKAEGQDCSRSEQYGN